MDTSAYCGLLADHRGVIGSGCVVIEDGVIIDISKSAPREAKTIDYTGKGYIIAPGLIDMHVHLRGLNLSYKEDERSGSKAAAASGITLVVDMPNTSPRVASPDVIDLKLSSFSKPLIDYGVYSGVPDESKLVGIIAEMPVAGFKVYPEDILVRHDVLMEVLGGGGLVILHPELPQALQDYSESILSRSVTRGCHWEAAAVSYIASLNRSSRIHVTHASCHSTVIEAKRHGYTVDVTPHHLLFSASNEGCLYKVNPPIRGEVERSLLTRILVEGLIDAVASDHAPHMPWEKSEALTCSPGISWLEAWPWAIFRFVEAGAITLGEYLYLTSRGPALILGLKNYGVLDEGARGNLTIIDPRAKWRFPGPKYSKAKYTPSIMMELVGRPIATVVGGVQVYVDGEVIEGMAPGINPFNPRT